MSALILLASMSTIGLMAAFARQNRKEGWVKSRKTILDALRQAKRDLLTMPETASQVAPVAYAGLPIDPTDFANQLNRLQGSLRRANQPVIEPSATPAKESSPAKSVLVS